MSTVYVVSEPLRRDPGTGQWTRTHDVTPAQRFGDLVFLLPPGNEAPTDQRVVIRTLHQKLAHFGIGDYLLPIGHPLYIGWATAVAAWRTGGCVTMLHWRPAERAYVPITASLWLGVPGSASVALPEELENPV